MILDCVVSFAAAMLVHELGHLFAARAFGVRAPELGLGWGPKVFGRSVGGVEVKLHALPVGAYVRLDMQGLQSRPLVQQVVVLLAGIFVNLVAALVTAGSWFSLMNLLLAATNLLPLYQQDGWKCGMVMLRALLERRSALVEWTFTVVGGAASLAVMTLLALKYF